MAEREQESIYPQEPEYPVIMLTKEDLVYLRPDQELQIAELSDMDMARIADRLGSALSDTRWDALGTILDGFLPIPGPVDDLDELE